MGDFSWVNNASENFSNPVFFFFFWGGGWGMKLRFQIWCHYGNGQFNPFKSISHAEKYWWTMTLFHLKWEWKEMGKGQISGRKRIPPQTFSEMQAPTPSFFGWFDDFLAQAQQPHTYALTIFNDASAVRAFSHPSWRPKNDRSQYFSIDTWCRGFPSCFKGNSKIYTPEN